MASGATVRKWPARSASARPWQFHPRVCSKLGNPVLVAMLKKSQGAGFLMTQVADVAAIIGETLMPLKKLLATMAIASLAISPTMAATTKTPAAKPAAAAAKPALDPEAKMAIDRMGVYLRTLKSFEVVADGYSEDVLDSGQKVTMPGRLSYAVVVPDKLFAEISSDRTLRRFYFNGSKVTIDAPRHMLYTDAPLKGTINTLFKIADQKYGIAFPLQDLFLWGDTAHPVPAPISGFKVGPETIGDAKVDHYAFHQTGIDWQVWIAQGDKPLPLRIVMTNLDDAARPQYAANLTWQTDAVLAADRFTFTPPAGSGRIAIATVDGSAGETK
jgi:hypothetical protein